MGPGPDPPDRPRPPPPAPGRRSTARLDATATTGLDAACGLDPAARLVAATVGLDAGPAPRLVAAPGLVAGAAPGLVAGAAPGLDAAAWLDPSCGLVAACGLDPAAGLGAATVRLDTCAAGLGAAADPARVAAVTTSTVGRRLGTAAGPDATEAVDPATRALGARPPSRFAAAESTAARALGRSARPAVSPPSGTAAAESAAAHELGAPAVRPPSRIGIAVALQWAGVLAFAAVRSDRRVIAYAIVWSGLALLVRAAHRRHPLPPATLGALFVGGAVHLAGGLAPSPDPEATILYETWLVPGVVKFDQLAHAGICAVVTVALFQWLAAILRPETSVGLRATLAAVGCWGFGAANELLEFLSTLRFDDSYAGDLTNAGWDLAFNTAGSVAAALAVTVLARVRPVAPAT